MSLSFYFFAHPLEDRKKKKDATERASSCARTWSNTSRVRSAAIYCAAALSCTLICCCVLLLRGVAGLCCAFCVRFCAFCARCCSFCVHACTPKFTFPTACPPPPLLSTKVKTTSWLTILVVYQVLILKAIRSGSFLSGQFSIGSWLDITDSLDFSVG